MTSGRPAFQQHAKRAEGSDTSQPCTFRKYCAQSEKTATSPSCKQITQPCGAATPEEADARCKRAHPFPPACCIIPRSTSHRAEMPRVCTCEPMCRLLRGRVASLSQREISSRFWANLSKIPVRRKRSRRKALALFAPMPIHSSPQCELPQGFAGFGN